MKISFSAGGKSWPLHEATTLIRLSRKILPESIWFMAVSISFIVISDNMPLFPPTFIAKFGTSFSKYLKVRKVVPSPPRVMVKSSFVSFNTSKSPTFFAPSTSTGEMVNT